MQKSVITKSLACDHNSLTLSKTIVITNAKVCDHKIFSL